MPVGTLRRVAAYGVHAFTASGAVFGMLSLDAVYAGDLRRAFLWLAVALVVDMFDGTLARWVDTKHSTPEFDGALLDNIIDYFNYVIVPAFILVKADLLPEGWRWVAAALVCMSSGYQFSRADAKTEDHYFLGFPSEWNLAVFYLALFDLSQLVNLVVILALVVLIFVPIKYLYPSRTERFRRTTIVLSVVWMVATAVVLYQFPNPHPLFFWPSVAYVGYYFGASFWINYQGRYR